MANTCMYNTHKSKGMSLAAVKDGYADPVKHWGACALNQVLRAVLAKPPEGGLVPHRWSCTMP